MKKYYFLGSLVFLLVLVLGGILLFKSSDNFRFNVVTRAPMLVKIFHHTGVSSYEQSYYETAEHFFYDKEAYDLVKSEYVLSKYTGLGIKADRRPEAMYLLSRIYLAQNELDKAMATIDAQISKGVSWERMHYMKGLVLGYKGELEEAQRHMERFVSVHPQEWAGYLDLSWILFRQGKTVEAGGVLEKGLERHADNPWLLSAYGVIQYNYQNKELAEETLLKAQKQAETITPELWRQSYSANDPTNIESEIQQFKDVVAYNLNLVNNDYEISLEETTRVFDANFADVGARGALGGLHVSACDSAQCHNGCQQVCNVCGVCQCSFDHSTNQCNLGAPALPASYNNQCFAQNRCQQNVEATVGCDGNCVLTIPENPIPAANGFYRVEHNESIYLYNAGFEDVCYLFTNNNLTGDAVFVPANSQQEYLNFIGADLITVPGTGFGLEDVTSQPGIYNSDGTPF